MPAATRIKTRGRRLGQIFLTLAAVFAAAFVVAIPSGTAASTCSDSDAPYCSTTSVVPDTNSVTTGGTVNFAVTVAAVAPQPDAGPFPSGGNVAIQDASCAGQPGCNQYGSVLLPSSAKGTVTIAIAFTTSGTYNVAAVYSGNDYAKSYSDPVTITVSDALLPDYTESFTASSYHVVQGQDVTFDVSITDKNGVDTKPSGTVTFQDASGNCLFSGNQCPQADVVNGRAETTIPWPLTGSTQVTAMYKGTQYVQGASSTITIVGDSNAPTVINTTTKLNNGQTLQFASNEDVMLTATVTAASTFKPATGDQVTFYKTYGSESTSQIITPQAEIKWDKTGLVGTATVDAGQLAPGTWHIVAQYQGFEVDPSLSMPSSHGDVSVYPAGTAQRTTLTYAGDATDWAGQPDTIAFQLSAGGSVLGNEPVAITIAGKTYNVSTGPTDGLAIVKPSLPAGVYDETQITAHFAGDGQYLPTDGAGSLTVNQIPTATTVGAITNTNTGAPVTLSATLVDTGTSTSPVPLFGKTVTLSFGSDSCSDTTHADGTVSCTIDPVTTAPGSYTVTAAFAGDDEYSESDSGTIGNTIAVAQGVTTIVDNVTGNFLQGSTVKLSGTLSAYGHALAGEWIVLSFNGVSCTSDQKTGADGSASCTVTLSGPSAKTSTGASFAGDTNYISASDSKPALVYAYAPGGGSFVVGDNTASGSVYFWGSQWWKKNSLSAGDAKGADPAAFKGYAAQPASPQCGGTWSTAPGNSTPPPGGQLPAYMAVIVTSQNHKAGKVISGNIVHIVIVQTDAGYAGNPGHDGTGTVVAVLC